MKNLTPRQLEVLAYVQEYHRGYHCSPSLREIGQHFGWVSPHASTRHMHSLTAKGCVIPIVGANGSARGYRLSSKGRELVRAQKVS